MKTVNSLLFAQLYIILDETINSIGFSTPILKLTNRWKRKTLQLINGFSFVQFWLDKGSILSAVEMGRFRHQ